MQGCVAVACTSRRNPAALGLPACKQRAAALHTHAAPVQTMQDTESNILSSEKRTTRRPRAALALEKACIVLTKKRKRGSQEDNRNRFVWSRTGNDSDVLQTI